MKLHLGSGKRFLEGYTHVDLSTHSHIDYNQSIDNLGNFKDNSIQEIYASHVFEYFDLDNAKIVLAEWMRVLTTNGVLRLAVPNFDSLLEVYSKTGNIENILGPIFGKWEITSGNYSYHKTVYTEKLLTDLLDNAGFRNIKKWDWREVFKDNKEYDDHAQAYFPHMDKANGIHVSLNIEAQK
jgi:predicted SAM-dependent methyltransferase